MYTAPKLIELLEQQQQQRGQADLFKQGKFTIQWRAKVGSFLSPDLETMISAAEPYGAWLPKTSCPAHLSRPEDKRNVGENWKYFRELPLLGYVPASGVRGLVRSWVMAQKDPKLKQNMEELLGFQQNDTITTGKIAFLDAYPTEPTKVTLDIVNPQEFFQVFHQGQSTPLSFYTLGDGHETISITVAINGIRDRATPEDVEIVWNWLQQALSLYGIGSRTASGYGSLKSEITTKIQLEPGYSKKTFNFTLYTQGCAGADTKTMELRPSHWRGWLRSWVLRFLLGVMSQENAQKTLGELFGTIEPEDVKGCVCLKMIQGRAWGEKSDKQPTFYTWKGKIEISAPKDILTKIILPVVKFAVSVGGIGRGWRRPLHIFTMNNGRAAARGTHLILTHKVKSQQTKQLKSVLCGVSPAKPEQWQKTYQRWLEEVKNQWQSRINLDINKQLAAEVFSPHTCAIYVVPAPVEEPIDRQESTWAFTKAQDTRGDGMELIYQPKYKRKRDVGGSAAGGGNAHCSWVTIKRVNVPNKEEETDCQEIICLFLGQNNQLRKQFLKDLAKLSGAVYLFGVRQ